jgi:hypothetical protein
MVYGITQDIFCLSLSIKTINDYIHYDSDTPTSHQAVSNRIRRGGADTLLHGREKQIILPAQKPRH